MENTTTPQPNTTHLNGTTNNAKVEKGVEVKATTNVVKLPVPSTPTPAPLFQIIPIAKRTRYVSMLVYAVAGVGKTLLCSTAADVPAMRDVLFLNSDAGTLSVTGRDDLDEIPITSWSEVARIKEFLTRHCKARDAGDTEALAKMQKQYMGEYDDGRIRQYRTLVIDSLSECNRFLMYQLLGLSVGKQKIDDLFPDTEWGTYNKGMHMTQALMRELRSLPMNLLYICQEDVKEIGTPKRRYRQPELPGKLALQAQHFVDIVGAYTLATIDDPKGTPTTPGGNDIRKIQVRRLYLQPGPGYHAKNRYPGFTNRWIDNPTLAKITRSIEAPQPQPASE